MAVTGLGVICALGNNTVCTVQALENGLLPPRGNFTVLTQIAIWTWCRIALARPKCNLLFPTHLLSGVSTLFWRFAGRQLTKLGN